MNIALTDLKKLREATQAGVSDCRQALEDAGGDVTKAKKLLIARGLEKAAEKEGRQTSEGIIDSYIHANAKVGVLVEARCETDFVARNEHFKRVVHEIALQIAAVDPADVKELLASVYIRDASETVEGLVKQTIAKLGENIEIVRFIRFELGKNAKKKP